MRIVITGGAGFIGTHVVAELATRGHDVVAVDLPDQGHDSGTVEGVAYVWGDLRDPDVCQQACAQADAVCHLAGRTGPESLDQLPAFVAANDVTTGVLLHTLHLQRFNGRLVLGSSADVYGEGTYLCPNHGAQRLGRRNAEALRNRHWDPSCPNCGATVSPLPIRESEPAQPVTVYAATKIHQEHLFDCYANEHPGTAATALRFQNVYGRGMPIGPDAGGVVAMFHRDIASGRRPQVYEDGTQRRDFVHVSDAARAVVMALTVPDGHHGPLNIASGRSTTLLELATAMCVAHGTSLWPEMAGRYRSGDARHLLADPSLALATIGFRAEVPLTEGLARSLTATLPR